MESKALSFKPQHIAIYSNSWGPGDTGWQVEGPGTLAKEAMKQGVTLVSSTLLI